jgi:hypothetical protein
MPKPVSPPATSPIHLLRLLRAQPELDRLPLPLRGGGVELRRLVVPQDQVVLAHDLVLVLLDGEVVVDLEPGQFAHLRQFEALPIAAGRPLRVLPARESVVLWIQGSS